jgi:integrase/recombinase XerD
MNSSEWSLFDSEGRRKYLVESEFKAFIAAADTLPPRERAYCQTLAHTGGRLAEILALRKQDIDRKAGAVVIKSLKKRGKTIYRSIPIPPSLIATLELVFDLGRGKGDVLLWDVDQRTANRWVMKAMEAAGVEHTPRSLRHTFGVTAVIKGVPLTTIKKWLGHADIKTTAIYTDAMGEEERGLAERMWR